MTESRRASARPWARLNPTDVMFLRLERPEWPCHYGILLVVDGHELIRSDGSVPLAQLQSILAERVSSIPRLRRRIFEPGPFLGPPLWVDDAQFNIRSHVFASAVPAPGAESDLVAAALDLYERPLDRSRPLWELWLLTGMAKGKVGVLLKLHHTVADGLAAIELAAALTDSGTATKTTPAPWKPLPVPSRRDLLAERLGSIRDHFRIDRSSPGPSPRPSRRNLSRTIGGFLGSGGAAAFALNARVRSGRRLARVELDVVSVKAVAHAHGGKVNDVALALFTGGLRALLSARGALQEHTQIAAGQTVTLRRPDDPRTIDNRVGSVILHLPAGEPDVAQRLQAIIEQTSTARSAQQPTAIMTVLAALSATPLGAFYSAHQRAGNVLCTNVRGPEEPVSIFGAPVESMLPIIELVGNIAVTQIAFSYAGTLSLAITADATAFPDLRVVTSAMAHEWSVLAAGCGIAGHAEHGCWPVDEVR